MVGVMETQRIAPDRQVRPPDRTRSKRALFGMLGLLVLSLFSVWSPGRAYAKPLSPIVVDQAYRISGALPWISPTGEHLVTYIRQDAGGPPLAGLRSRIGGVAFTPFGPLSPRPALAPPTAAFGSDGTARLVWAAARTGSSTEQAVRPSGSPPGAATPVGSCDGPAALAVSRTDRTLSACRSDSGVAPRWTGVAGVGRMPSAIAPGVEGTPALEEVPSDPLVAWGTNGTGVVVFGYGEAGPPAEVKIAARVVGADGSFGEIEPVASAVDPETLVPTGAAVLPNGTVAITANSDEGALLFTRPAGPGRSFEQTGMDEDTASMPSADQWGRLHFLTSTRNRSGQTSWSVRVRDRDGSLRPPIPVPTEGSRPAPVENGFQVAPNGAEALIMKSDSGFSVSLRSPGPNGFFLPKVLARTTVSSPGAATRSPNGDILLTWEQDVAPGRQQLMLGGWHPAGRPVIERISAPRRAKRGARIKLSVRASDPMGVSRIIWKLPAGRRAEGASVRVRLWKRRANRIEVVVRDRAGHRAAATRRVKVVVPKKRRAQGRSGTSGSPRP